LRESAFAVAIGGKADIPFCTENPLKSLPTIIRIGGVDVECTPKSI